MKKRVIAIFLCFTLVILCIPVLADNLDVYCQYFLDFIDNAINLYSDYKVENTFLYETSEDRVYHVKMINETDDYSAAVRFSKTKDGNSISGYTIIFQIEDHLYDNDERFDQIAHVIFYTLASFMESDNTIDIYYEYLNRLNQYFYEESARMYSYQNKGFTLTLEYMKDEYLVLVTLQ